MPPPWSNKQPYMPATGQVQGRISHSFSPDPTHASEFDSERRSQERWLNRSPPAQAPAAGPTTLRLGGAKSYEPRGPEASGKPRRWTMQQLRAGDAIIPVQSGTNQFASQQGMTGFGTPRNTTTPVFSSQPWLENAEDDEPNRRIGRWTEAQLRATDAVVPLQSGTNQYASQQGMTGFGRPRDVRGPHLHRIWDGEQPQDETEQYEHHPY